MSFRLAVEAFDAKVGNPLRKLVLLKLADQANDEGLCWPSYETVAKACEVDRRSVIRHIKKLEEDGFLRVEKVYDKEAKKNKSNRYHLTVSNGVKKSLVTESHHPSDRESLLGSVTESPPSVTESPKPINESINKPINESINESRTTKKKKVAVEKPNELSQQTWDDLLDLRKSKKAPLSATAWKMADNAIEAIQYKTGHSIEQIVTVWVARGWTTIKEEWYFNHIKNDQPQQTNYQGNNNANSQSHSSQSKQQLNHFDQLRAEAAAKYGRADSEPRTVSDVT